MIIAFDVDGTLVGFDDKPRWDIIDMLRLWHKLGHSVIVWSGGGKDYAEMWVRRLQLAEFVEACYIKQVGDAPLKNTLTKKEVDICFDDEAVNLGQVNVKV